MHDKKRTFSGVKQGCVPSFNVKVHILITSSVTLLNNQQLPSRVNEAKFLDRRLTVLKKKTTKMYWPKNSKLTLENKVLLHNTILKPIWNTTLGEQQADKTQKYFKDFSANDNWFVPIWVIQQSECKTVSVRNESKNFYLKYETRLRTIVLAVNLLNKQNKIRRLNKYRYKTFDFKARLINALYLNPKRTHIAPKYF